MKVSLFGVDGDFDKNRGESLQRYMYELYINLIRQNIDVIKELPSVRMPFSRNGLSLLFYDTFKDLSQYDIVHNLDVKPVLPLRRGKAKLVVTVHDLIPIKHQEFNIDYRRSLRDLMWLWMVTKPGLHLALRASDYIIAISSQVREEVIAMGYDKERVFKVNNGVDSRFLKKLPKKVERKRFVVGYLGSFVYRKNVRFALDAFIKMDAKDAVFSIWGKRGLYTKDLEHKAIENKRILFNGAAKESNIVNVYDSFDAFVFPTLYEGFGLPIIEAQARGLPVVIYKKGQLPREVRKCCLEAEDEAHMAQILQDLRDNGYNEKRRKEATEYARTFTWKNTALETTKVYKKVSDS
jgi:glycosyltransferase involved in cell wall biosynthesis